MSARRDFRRWMFGFACLLAAMVAGSARVPVGAQTKDPVTFSKDIAPIWAALEWGPPFFIPARAAGSGLG